MTWNVSEMADVIVAKLRSRSAPADQLDYLGTYHTAAIREFARMYEPRFPQATVLNMGGSGIVLTLSGSQSSETASTSEPLAAGSTPARRCLKYPHPCVGLPGNFSLTDVIDNEAKRLREINHPHIMPLE